MTIEPSFCLICFMDHIGPTAMPSDGTRSRVQSCEEEKLCRHLVRQARVASPTPSPPGVVCREAGIG